MNKNAMLVAQIRIKGIRPLLYNTFTQETLSLNKKERTGIAGNDPDEWKRSFLSNEKGQLFIHPSYIFGSMREAAKYTKNGRGSIQGKVAATLQILSPQLLINRFIPKLEISDNPNELVYLDIRSVKNPTTKGRNIRYRLALSAGWETSFEIAWDKTIVNRQQIQSVLLDAGALVGVGDGRTIGFGRFTVTEFTVLESNSFHIEEFLSNNAEKENAL